MSNRSAEPAKETSSVDVAHIIKQAEDHLFRNLKFSVRERAVYYYLLRHTHLEGKIDVIVSIQTLANAIGVSDYSAREDLRSLHDRCCIKIAEPYAL